MAGIRYIRHIPKGHDRQAELLESVYQRYHDPEFICPDPLEKVRLFSDAAEREIAALIAACLSYGNVRSILRGIDDVLNRLDGRPRSFLLDNRPAAIRHAMKSFRYRVTSEQTMSGLLIGIRGVLHVCDSLEACTAEHANRSDSTILPAIGGMVTAIERHAGISLDHLLPHPSRRSACKRLMLFARWMVRCDTVDPGGWTRFAPAQLVVPLDTHMYRVAEGFGWLTRRSADLAAAVQITEALRRFNRDDPLRYDFALTRPGIRREPWLEGQTA